MPAGAGNPPNIKMEPPKSNFNIREGGGGGGGRFNIRGKGLELLASLVGTVPATLGKPRGKTNDTKGLNGLPYPPYPQVTYLFEGLI